MKRGKWSWLWAREYHGKRIAARLRWQVNMQTFGLAWASILFYDDGFNLDWQVAAGPFHVGLLLNPPLKPVKRPVEKFSAWCEHCGQPNDCHDRGNFCRACRDLVAEQILAESKPKM